MHFHLLCIFLLQQGNPEKELSLLAGNDETHVVVKVRELHVALGFSVSSICSLNI